MPVSEDHIHLENVYCSRALSSSDFKKIFFWICVVDCKDLVNIKESQLIDILKESLRHIDFLLHQINKCKLFKRKKLMGLICRKE